MRDWLLRGRYFVDVFNLHVQPYPQSAVSEVCFCFIYLFIFFAVQDT